MNACTHRNIIGNSKGETCMDCGEVLAGYGHLMQSHVCSHTDSFNEDREGICSFCYLEQNISGSGEREHGEAIDPLSVRHDPLPDGVSTDGHTLTGCPITPIK